MEEEMVPSLDERKKYCEELTKFTEDVDNEVKLLCSLLGYDFDSINDNEELFLTCPFNSGHSVPESSMERHLKQCEWNALGYTKDCKPLPESFVPEKSPSTIKFDMELQQKVLKEAKQKNPSLNIESYEYYLHHGIIISFFHILYCNEEKLIPQTSDRLMSDFTVDERKAMYEYVIANTVAPDIGHDITDLNKPEKPKEENTTILELLSQERNLKRRRAKYKGVHTNKKSHTEILREVVEQQMEMYKEYLIEKFGTSIIDNEDNTNSNDKKDETKKIKSDELCYDEQSGSSLKYKSYKNSDNYFSSSTSRHEFGNTNEKYKKSSKHYKDNHFNSYKSSSHKDYNSKSTSKVLDYNHSQRNYDRREFSKHSWDHQDKYHSSDKNYNEKDFRHKRKNDNSHDFRRSRSRSGEKNRDERVKNESQERKNHKKHKKEHKHKRDKSNDDDKSHRHSKQKRSKHRSRSRS